MPELPEVETTLRGLAPVLEGATLARVVVRTAKLRYRLPPHLAERLQGRRVTALTRRAKFMRWDLDHGESLLVHLGMSGRFVVRGAAGAAEAPSQHDHLEIETESGARLVLNDARRFGMLDLVPTDAVASHPWLAGLGPEPLAADFDGPRLQAKLRGRKAPLKAALLDQATVAGLGNIYVCEALFAAGLSPRRQAGTVGPKRAARLAQGIQAVLGQAIAAGGASLKDYRHGTGELGYFQNQFAVYDRAGSACPGCTCDVARTGGIQRLLQSNRSTYFCPRKQR